MTEPYVLRVAEYALSGDEGAAAYALARPHINDGRTIVLDFSGCHVLCTHWLSGFYSRPFHLATVAEVHAVIQETGASPTNQQAIDLMYQLAEQWEREHRGGEHDHP